MMYEFTDTNRQPGALPLPAEALQINGAYIEHLVEGYRTLSVQGREALSADVSTDSVGLRPGSVYVSKKYPERVIKVKYQLISETPEAFRAAYNTLAAILDVEEARLVFNDEPDKFFTGIPGTLETVEPGRNAVVSTITFVCPDPHKYSVREYEAEVLQDGSLYCNYHGTVPAHPKFSAQFLEEGDFTDAGEASSITGNGDCGYVAFFDASEHILQFGDPDEVDGEELEPTQTLLAASLKSSSAWTNAVKAVWPTNGADAVVTTGAKKTGTAGMVPTVSSVTDASKQYFTGATSYGTETGWHGPVISAEIPDDASGGEGASSFMFQFTAKCLIGLQADDTKRFGGISCYISDAEGNKVLGVRIYKSKAGTTGNIAFIVGGSVMETVEIDFSTYNKYFGNNRSESYKTVGGKKVLVPASKANRVVRITKTGDEVTISAGGIVRTYETSNLPVVTRISIQFQAYGTRAPLTYCGIFSWKFDKLFCDTWREDPNKFTASDLLEVDCSGGSVLLNGSPMPGLGALGNQWEEFKLLPGENIVGWACSDWCDTPPTVGMKYREVYL